MRAFEAIRRSGIGIEADRTLHDAAMVMDQAGVGALAVLEGDRLVGMVTDRDLVRRGLARGRSADDRVASIMTSPVITIDAKADLHEAFALFRANAVRRLAVVGENGFIGVITIDDLLIDLARDLADLARPITSEVLYADRGNAITLPD